MLHLACVGDSITAGAGLSDPASTSYPAVLGQLLGANYQVSNFGLSGSTLLIDTALSYQKSASYRAALAAKPDIVVVALGSNDAMLSFSAALRTDFVGNYQQLIDDFRRARLGVRFYLCIPPTAYGAFVGRTQTIRSTLAPLIRQIAADNNARVIDLFGLTQDQPELFADSLHPNEAGARKIAAEIGRVVVLP